MRITFLTCLSLLFSTQVYAGKWLVDGESDCKIWSPDPIGPNETITYTSQCVDGKAQGKGSITVYDNGNKSRFYEGEFENGVSSEDRDTNKDDNKYSGGDLASTPFHQTM